MKRILLLCLLFVLGLAVLSCPGEGVFAKPKSGGSAPQTPVPAAPAPQPLAVAAENAYEVLASHKNLSKFVEMIDDADLKSMFVGSPNEPLTVFAPTDDAIGDIPRDVMKRIKASKASLQSFVKYHAITNSLVGSNAIIGRKVSPASANGEPLVFDGVTKKDMPTVNDAMLVEADIPAANGIIHIVGAALVPPSLKAEPVAQATAPEKPVAPQKPTTPVVKPAEVVSPVGAMGVTATGATTTPATPPVETTTGAVPEVTPDSPAQQPPPAPVGDDSGKGFTLFGHKFGG